MIAMETLHWFVKSVRLGCSGAFLFDTMVLQYLYLMIENHMAFSRVTEWHWVWKWHHFSPFGLMLICLWAVLQAVWEYVIRVYWKFMGMRITLSWAKCRCDCCISVCVQYINLWDAVRWKRQYPRGALMPLAAFNKHYPQEDLSTQCMPPTHSIWVEIRDSCILFTPQQGYCYVTSNEYAFRFLT